MSRQRRCRILIAASVALTIPLIGCASKTHIVETSAAGGDPLIVASKVSADTINLADNTGQTGGARVERRDITGMVVMPMPVYRKWTNSIQDAVAAVERAEREVVLASQKNGIVEVLARKCRETEICFAAAKPHIEKVMGLR